MERPALKRLIADIEAGQIDVIVVYKVDRLTRARSQNFLLVVRQRYVRLFISRQAQAVIGVNTHHAPVRQNFTTAHELGHLLLHDQEQRQLYI